MSKQSVMWAWALGLVVVGCNGDPGKDSGGDDGADGADGADWAGCFECFPNDPVL